jgi:hypothetical protein
MLLENSEAVIAMSLILLTILTASLCFLALNEARRISQVRTRVRLLLECSPTLTALPVFIGIVYLS